jgi:hypothetical protein
MAVQNNKNPGILASMVWLCRGCCWWLRGV